MIIHPNVTTPKPSLLVKLILHLVNNHKNKDDNVVMLPDTIKLIVILVSYLKANDNPLHINMEMPITNVKYDIKWKTLLLFIIFIEK